MVEHELESCELKPKPPEMVQDRSRTVCNLKTKPQHLFSTANQCCAEYSMYFSPLASHPYYRYHWPRVLETRVWEPRTISDMDPWGSRTLVEF